MKKLAIVAALVLFVACAPKADEAAPAADAPATTPAATMDTAMTMDTTKTDSAAAPMADTTKH